MKVIVCGGGIAGLTLTLCLDRAGHEVIVVERSPGLRASG